MYYPSHPALNKLRLCLCIKSTVFFFCNRDRILLRGTKSLNIIQVKFSLQTLALLKTVISENVSNTLSFPTNCSHRCMSNIPNCIYNRLPVDEPTRFETYRVKKVKCTLVQALGLCTGRKAQRGNRGIALIFRDYGTRRGRGVEICRRHQKLNIN